MSLSKEEKQKVFREELEHMRKNGYITNEEFTRLLHARGAYLADSKSQKKEPTIREQVTTSERAKPVKSKRPMLLVKKKKNERTPEQIRERNITWSLILGVAILLVTGLIVATSQWDQMGAVTKVVSISFVSLFFFILSYGTGRFLKIKQTAFAFLTLGSLLLPIIIVAVGYFELLGSSISLFGKGRHLLGLIGTGLPLPLYIRHAFVHRSRLYVWISLLFLSLSVGFALGALPLSVDIFYFGLMLYNAALLWAYTRYRTHGTFKLFTTEVPLFTQLNLVLSTLLMLFFFESELFYSFNVLLTATVYMAMVFVYKTREYQFVFSVMIVYAVYQLVENTPLVVMDELVYALVGMLYLGFAYAFQRHTFINQVFRYTSGVVSFLAFLYMTYESILIQEEAGSWILFSAYGVITINYLVLSHLTNYVLFTYLTPVFFFISMAQLWDFIQTGPWFVFLFFSAILLLLYVGVWTRSWWLASVKESSFYTALFMLIGCLYFSLGEARYDYSSLMLLMVSITAYYVKRGTINTKTSNTAVWVLPMALVSAAVTFYPKVLESFPAYEDGFSISSHLAIAALILIAFHYIWRRLKEIMISNSTFYVAQGTYILAMLSLFTNVQVDVMVVRPLLLFVGMAMMYLLVQFTGKSYLWGCVSIVAFAFYLSLIEPFGLLAFSSVLTYLVFAPVVLLVIGEAGEKKWPGIRPYFYWLGHIIQPLVIGLILLNQMGSNPVHPLILIVPLVVYLFSSWAAVREWEVQTMLYAAMSIVFLQILTVPSTYGLWENTPKEYAFFVSSILFSLLWWVIPPLWQKRVEGYIVPFSIFGLIMIVTEKVVTGPPVLLTGLGYAVLILFFLHQREWWLVRFIPLGLTLVVWEKADISWSLLPLTSALVTCIAALAGMGRIFHERLVGPGTRADAYSWAALAYIAYLSRYTVWDESVWIRILPVLLLGGWLFLGANRWFEKWVRSSFYSGAAASMYVVYLMILEAYREPAPDLFLAEFEVLPIIGVLTLLRRRVWSASKEVMNWVQFAALLFIAGYLVVDAIQSHTIWDAWIIGGLSLLSMVTGMQLRIKSYLLVGMGVMIFNILYQTRPYWGNVPWWVYLLIAGLVLIGIASYNEWQKQRSESDSQGEQKWRKVWKAFKKWN
ncbi:hypothetical protein [Halobacillus karajensis]|uniref:DUF2157 domain-containing protein n=1 Tax=Halobacillus karajensis TaxID=195088 RepID=A0A024P855_9BACI|nr:hypothetical protein [Halobacillus karajensis]CDQ20306.1 hypothetical protein BN982_02629 [Halobacillus karajensis]CDQ25033.1 hypothetical protein BN983_03338 [Halobacillus karajensis]CDQ28606.1 hypothetical protein BN981_02914 [Halobacillus karajensis]